MLKVEIEKGVTVNRMELGGDVQEIYENVASLIGHVYSLLYRNYKNDATLFRRAISEVLKEDMFWILSACTTDGEEYSIEDKSEEVSL